METSGWVSDLLTCSECRTENPSGARFCNACGTQLAAGDSGGEERKLVSVLFVDLVGFTARSDRADPEDVRDTLQSYYGRARERIEAHGGTVEKFIGDAVMAVFGAEMSHGDDTERAVRAGFAVLASIEELNRTQGFDLSARAAVNTGEAVVAVGGDGADALAIGDVVNTASRLQAAAPPGGLIVGSEAYRATRQMFRYEPLASIEAKGKSEPVEAWLAVEPVTAPAERPIATNPLVGRSHEFELMRSAWERAATEERPQLVTVLGPPGIGKSRLCREVTELVDASGGRVLRGRCLPYEEQTGYQAFATIIRQVGAVFESDQASVALEKLERALSSLLPDAEAAEITRHLAVLAGVGGDINVPQAGLLYFAARRLLECLGQAQPTLVVFDDIHWAQPSEIELLTYLAGHVRDTSIVLVAVARPELLNAHPSWGSGLIAQTTIPLEPLDPAEAAALAASALGASAGSEPTLARIVEIAEGNPLFIEELAATVGDLRGTDQLPVTVKAAIASRIDTLPAEARAVLLAAAVVGKTFWRGVLEAMEVGDGLDDALDLLEARNLIRRQTSTQVPGDIEFMFRHMLIREVAFGTVPRATRRRWHAAVASYIEQASGGATETLAWILAHHWREAGEPSKAIPHLLRAALVAQRGWAKDAAVDLYTTALELADDPKTRLDIRLKRGRALLALGDLEAASVELGEILPELSDTDRLEALLARGQAVHWLELDAETLEIANEAVTLASSLDDKEALPAAIALKSHAYGMVGHMNEALELAERALKEWVPGTRPDDLANHLHLHADFNYWAGRYQRCAELSEQARSFATDVRSPEALMRGGGTQAMAHAAVGEHEQAIQIWDEMFAIAKELGRNPRVLLNYSSLAYREVFDLAEARRRSEEALELSAGESFSMPRNFAAADLLLTDLLAGDIGRAQTTWPRLRDQAEAATAWTKWLIYGRLATARAEIALATEPAEATLEWAQEALEITRNTKRRKYEARASSILGEALGKLGRKQDALTALNTAITIADELIGPPARWHARATLGRVAYSLGDDDTAALAYEEAATLIHNFAATLAPERAGFLLQAPQITAILNPTPDR